MRMSSSEFPEMDLLAHIYMEADWALSGADEAVDITPSARFKSKIARIIFVERGLAYLRKAAMILVMLMVGLGMLLAVNEDVRASLYRKIFKKTYSTHTVYDDGIYPSHIDYKDMVYVPTWIPEGYELRYSDIGKGLGYSASYVDKDLQEVFFTCHYTANASVGLNTENTTETMVEIDGKQVEYHESYAEGFNSSLIWIDEDTRLVYIAAEEDYETLKQIFLSMKEETELFKEADDLNLGKDYQFEIRQNFYDENMLRYQYSKWKDEEIETIITIEMEMPPEQRIK